MSKVLVTGASGFIGRKLVSHFLCNGHIVIGWDRMESLDEIAVQYVDMTDSDAITLQLRKYQPDIVIHCAGSADVGKSVQNPEWDYTGNVTLTHNLLFAMHALGMQTTRFVFLSSAGVYGNPVSLPITEDMPVNPLSPYALHKVMCEDICSYFIKNYQMDIKIARIFSAYGSGLKKQIFWDMYKKVKQYGSLDMFGTGLESRDYIHVDDVVQALYLLATAPTDEICFNVANGEEVTIRQAAEMFADYAGIGKNYITFNGTVREGDPLNWRANIDRIQRLGYRKTVEMQAGLKDYYNWVDCQP